MLNGVKDVPALPKINKMRPNWNFETCACCTREQRLAWNVSNEVWSKAVIDYYHNKTLCLECFLRIADVRGIEIKLQDINFLGLIA